NTLDLPNNKVQSLLKSVNYDFAQPYILFVSTLEPRKNINNLIAAFNYLKQRHQIEHQLVLIGQKGWSYESIFAAIASSPWKDHIHHLGYLSDQLVAWFYSNADVFVYPSYYEGFGLPVLEAMTLGAPVVTSNTSSLPEVAGDAAILIDPNQPIELADAIVKVISNSSLREELIRKGKERAMLFSWERTARETLAAYTSLVGKGRGGRVVEGSSLVDD
ncbi:MAG: glycosyltransferase family 4 protein, partial [Moorea sp. SIO3C2]|nr:glycosyltransferase family 4 protein [Moorena sp. SIO3C2]